MSSTALDEQARASLAARHSSQIESGLRLIAIRWHSFALDRFPVLAGSGFVFWLASYHLLLGTKLGFASWNSSGPVPVGLLYNPIDNLEYVSWGRQAISGKMLGSIVYTFTPNSSLYFNPFFYSIGVAARFTGLPAISVFNFFGMVGIFIAIVATYHAALEAGLTRAAARWSVSILALASGLSAASAVVCWALGVNAQPWRGADTRYLEAFSGSTFIAYPYHTFCVALTALAVYLVLHCLRDTTHLYWRYISLAATVLLLGLSHPYEAPVLVAMFLSFSILSNRTMWRRKTGVTLTLLIAVTPAVGYGYWLSRHPLWNHFAKAALQFHPSRLAWIIGFGALIPLMIVGSVEIFRNRAMDNARWLVLWAAVVLGLLVIFDVSFAKICDSLAIPVAVLAGQGVESVTQCYRRVDSSRIQLASGFALAAYAFLLVSTNLTMYFTSYTPVKIDGPVLQALRQIEGADPGATLLCDLDIGAVAPGLARVRVFAGYWVFDPNFRVKEAALAQGGFAIDGSRPSHWASGSKFRELIAVAAPRWILTRADTPAASFARGYPGLLPIINSGPYRLFQAASASPRRDALKSAHWAL